MMYLMLFALMLIIFPFTYNFIPAFFLLIHLKYIHSSVNDVSDLRKVKHLADFAPHHIEVRIAFAIEVIFSKVHPKPSSPVIHHHLLQPAKQVLVILAEG